MDHVPLRRRLLFVSGVVLGLNVLAVLGLAGLRSLDAAAVNIGLLAYFLGVRHAFDPDHIAAIDNVTRHIRAGGARPAGVGLFFSLGHSTVVILLTTLLAFGARYANGFLASLTHWAPGVGQAVSAAFLTAIGLANLLLFRRLIRARQDRETKPEPLPPASLRPWLRLSFARIDRSWKMYPMGMLFGLGFDTATEIAVLVISVSAAQSGALPFLGVMIFPLLFTAGMSLMDSCEGLVMLRAYDWAIADTGRTLRLNVVLTGLSVLLALAVAGLRWSEVLLGPSGSGTVPMLDGSVLGISATVVLVALWLLASALKRLRGRVRPAARHTATG